MTRLRFLVSPSDRRCGPGALADDLLSVSIHRGVVPRMGETDDLPRSDDLTSYKTVRCGDVVLNRMRAFQGAVGRSCYDGIVSPDYTVLKPGHEVDSRYLHHLFRSHWFIGEMVSRLRGIGSTDLGSVRTPRINWEDLGEIEVSAPPLAEQRAIADYLDAETARIDALITKKQQLLHLLEERAQSSLFDAVGDWRVGEGHTLRQHGTRVLTGPFGTVLSASEYVSGGVPLVNPTHIKDGRIVPEEGVSVPEKVANRIARHRLSIGDLVMGRKGDVGRSAIVTSREEGWICGSDSIAIRCSRNLDPEFLAIALHVGIYRQQLAANSTGAMVLSVNEGTLLGLELPAMSPQEQRAAVLQSRVLLRRQERLRSLLDRHLNLLVEHRQALITAAVTGDFAVPGAA